MEVRFLPAGDTALVVEFGDQIDRSLSERVLRLAAKVKAQCIAGVMETVPTYRSLLVHYSPLQTDGAALQECLHALLDDDAVHGAPARLWHVPACYEAAHAPDIEEVAQRTRLSTSEVIRLHSETLFHIYMIGFVPGYPYMGDLPPELVLPRRADPRTRVPAGSVAIASTMTAVYPLESPGGWNLIGATPVRLFNPDLPQPALFRPGDKVRFEPVGAAQFKTIRQSCASGDYELCSETIKP